MSKREAGFTRRQFVIGGTAVGAIAAMPLLGRRLEGSLQHAFADQVVHGVGGFGEETAANRVVYTTCEQCNTHCTIKVSLTDPAKTGKPYIRKIAGNPYSPLNMVPVGQIPYGTDPAEAVKGLGDMPVDGRSLRGGRTCLKGQAGIQTAYDAYRLAKPLKRVGPRGSGKWQSLSWEQALAEIAAVVKPSLAFVGKEPVMQDWTKVKQGQMTQAEFDAKYGDKLIDTKRPDLGPKANQIAFLTGDRQDFMQRIVGGGFGCVNMFNHQSICGVSGVTAAVRTRNGKAGKNRIFADMDNCEYMIAWGTNLMTASKGPTWLAPTLTNAIARGLKLVVVDPRLSKTAEKAHLWVPVKPGGDPALAIGMIRWIIENKRYDAHFLTKPGGKAAQAGHEPNWSDATHLVNVSAPGKPKLKAKDLGLGDETQFVVLQNGQPALAETATEGQLEVDGEVKGIKIKSAFTLLKERAFEHTLAEYAELAGVKEATIVEMARDFTAHGKKAVAVPYRGPAMHTNGFYAVQAISILNFLVGNHDWKGGENSSGVRFAEVKGKRYDLTAVPNGRNAWGVPITREKSVYEQSTYFTTDGYPAKRRWYPFGANLTHEVIPSAYEGYPYPLKALFINRISPLESVGGGQFQAEMLKDEQRLPLVVAFDITVGGTSQYADYILPDNTYLERFGLQVIYPNQNLKESHVMQPAIKVMDGPRTVEDVMIDLAKQLGLPGVGDKAFTDGSPLNNSADYYLKLAANIAFDEPPVPDASPEEQKLFISARQQALGDGFNYSQWRSAVKPDEWAKLIYVLNRGGRFAAVDTGYDGDWLKMRHNGQLNLYDEGVAKAKSSFDGSLYDGIPRIEPVKGDANKPVSDDLPLAFINWKSSHIGTHRNIGDAWLREIRPANPVWMHPRDAAARGLKSGDKVTIRSASAAVAAEVYVTESIRPGTVGADFSYGHAASGAKAMAIDGVLIPPVTAYGHTPFRYRETMTEPTGYAAGRGTGFRVNDLVRQDERFAKGTPLSDPLGGSVSQLDTRVEITGV
ncbi:MAG TPA: molybdopterin-dependent oxidoreductase [Symbiobacteriaceae bacterium]